MKVLDKIFTIAGVLVVMSAMAAHAQTKAFKKQWTRLDGPVYYQCATVEDKMPKGSAIFSLYGFDKDQDLKADFFLSGNIVAAEKDGKQWVFVMEKSHLDFTGELGRTFTFHGDLNFTVAKAKNKHYVFTFYPGSGSFSDGSTRYTLIEDGIDRMFWNTGYMTLDVEAPKKERPVLYADLASLNLPRITVYTRPMRENTLSDFFSGRNRNVKVKGADLARMVMKNPARANASNFPEYREYVTQYMYKDGKSVVRVLTDSIDLGTKVHTSQYDVRRIDDALVVTMGDGNARYEGGEPKYATWRTSEGNGIYRNDTLYRYDGSRLTGISFAPATRENGYIISELEVLGSIADPNMYDFSEAAKSSGLRVRRYISADGSVVEDIVDNAIPSVKNDKAFSGPDRTLADVRGLAKSVTVTSTQADNMVSTYTFDEDGFFTGPIAGYASLNSAFDEDALASLKWEDLGYGRSAVSTVKSASVGALSVDFKVTRDGSGYISEIGLISSPSYSDFRGSTTILWLNNHPGRMWTQGWEDEPTVYTYDKRERLIKEQYESKEGEPGIYTWTYGYGDEDDHGNWLDRTVHFSFVPAVGSAEEPAEQEWVESRRIEYYTCD